MSRLNARKVHPLHRIFNSIHWDTFSEHLSGFEVSCALQAYEGFLWYPQLKTHLLQGVPFLMHIVLSPHAHYSLQSHVYDNAWCEQGWQQDNHQLNAWSVQR